MLRRKLVKVEKERESKRVRGKEENKRKLDNGFLVPICIF